MNEIYNDFMGSGRLNFLSVKVRELVGDNIFGLFFIDVGKFLVYLWEVRKKLYV